jgi:hypothetical protein
MARITVRMPIPKNYRGMTRAMITYGLDPDTVLEFLRGDVVCLRGTARAFASFTHRFSRDQGSDAAARRR